MRINIDTIKKEVAEVRRHNDNRRSVFMPNLPYVIRVAQLQRAFSRRWFSPEKYVDRDDFSLPRDQWPDAVRELQATGSYRGESLMGVFRAIIFPTSCDRDEFTKAMLELRNELKPVSHRENEDFCRELTRRQSFTTEQLIEEIMSHK